MEQIIEAMPSSAITFIASNSTLTNYIADTPTASLYWYITIEKNTINYVTCHAMRIGIGGNMMYMGRYHSNTTPKFQGWEPIATATPPQEFDLPLAAGYTAMQACRYFKTQDGVVTFFSAVHKSAVISSGDTVFTLPSGYRSSKRIDFPAGYANDDNAQVGGFGMLYADGTFHAALNASAGMTFGYFCGSFIATA